MLLEEYLAKQPMVRRYADRFQQPLFRYASSLPDKYFHGWLKTKPTIDQVALYYLGVKKIEVGHFISILVHLERNGLYTVLAIPGILTTDFWEAWRRNNIVLIMSAYDNFTDHSVTPITKEATS